MSLERLEISPDDIRLELERRRYRKLDYFFPDHGPLSRKGYKKHTDFIAATSTNRECCFMAANRSGKTETGAYAVTVWLTGEYPDWWEGRRFPGPVNILAAGETARLVRDSIQKKLLGEPGRLGEGMIPKELILSVNAKSGVPDAVDTVQVKHISGRTSTLQFQSFDQGREAFQATERHVVWEDEEPPLAVHNECLIRTMTTRGLVLLTFTPLKGMSDTVLGLMKKAEEGNAAVIRASWEDAPHLSEQDRAEMLAALPPFQRDARAKGIPQLGAGAVYPVAETDLLVEPFEIPKHWRKGYGMDVGWNYTAACWFAHDTEADVVYITSDYKRSQAEPASHAASIRARGELHGVIDPASQGRSQSDGKQLIELYRNLGLNLTLADNAVEAGIFEVYQRMTTGRLKIFKTCLSLIEEYRLYRRDEKGRIVKENDHVLDAMRYAVRSGLGIATAGEGLDDYNRETDPYARGKYGRQSWMGI